MVVDRKTERQKGRKADRQKDRKTKSLVSNKLHLEETKFGI